MTKQLQKNFDLWSTQKYSKVSKICLACAGIFFRVTNIFKATVRDISNLRLDLDGLKIPGSFIFSYIVKMM